MTDTFGELVASSAAGVLGDDNTESECDGGLSGATSRRLSDDSNAKRLGDASGVPAALSDGAVSSTKATTYATAQRLLTYGVYSTTPVHGAPRTRRQL